MYVAKQTNMLFIKPMFIQSAVSSAVTAVTYRREDNMIAVGHENGSLTVWGSKLMTSCVAIY